MDGPELDSRSEEIFSPPHTSMLAAGPPPQPQIQLVLGFFPCGKAAGAWRLTLSSRLRLSGGISVFPDCALTSCTGQINLFTSCWTTLTPRSRILLEKLTGFQLVKKFAAFYGTRRFITAFTRARLVSLFWARSVHYLPPPPTALLKDPY
jgi:hypothetical protein